MLSDNLRSLRRRRGENQEQVAEAVGITRQALSKWESGASLPDLPNCVALADYYGVTVDDLLGVPPPLRSLRRRQRRPRRDPAGYPANASQTSVFLPFLAGVSPLCVGRPTSPGRQSDGTVRTACPIRRSRRTVSA